jgi:hypothetical protein
MIVFTRHCLTGREATAFYAERRKAAAGESAVAA